jgi:hypothetical protein
MLKTTEFFPSLLDIALNARMAAITALAVSMFRLLERSGIAPSLYGV